MGNIPPVIIVSTGRCGSTLLSEMLALHPDILSLSEVFMAINTRAFVHRELDGSKFWSLMSKPRFSMSRILTPETCSQEFKFDFARSERYTQDTLPPILYMALPRLSDDPEALYRELERTILDRGNASLSDQYNFMFNWLRERFEKKVWIERSGGSLMFVTSLSRLFPDARFVHLYRDGRDVACSMQHYPSLRLLARSWHSLKKIGIDLLRPPFRIGDSKAIYFAEDFLAPLYGIDSRLKEEVDLEIIARFWSEMVLTGLEALSKIPEERRFNLSYEDLVSDTPTKLTQLLQFIHPDLSNNLWTEESARLVKHQPREAMLDSSSQRKLTAACAPGLKALGYAITPPIAAD